jgi:hypothetical protein
VGLWCDWPILRYKILKIKHQHQALLFITGQLFSNCDQFGYQNRQTQVINIVFELLARHFY